MTLGRFTLIIFLVCFAFATANITLSYVHKQDIHELLSGKNKCIQCNLNNAKLTGLNLEGYDLTQASMVGADLRCANLKKANLSGAILKSANLTGAKLDEADLLFTNMDNVTWEDGTDCRDYGA